MADFYGIDNKIELHEVHEPHGHQEAEKLEHEEHGLASINDDLSNVKLQEESSDLHHEEPNDLHHEKPIDLHHEEQAVPQKEVEPLNNLDDHLNFDEPPVNETSEDYNMIQPKSLIPGVVIEENKTNEELNHEQAIEEPIEKHVHGEQQAEPEPHIHEEPLNDHPGSFSMPLVRHEYPNGLLSEEELLEPNHEEEAEFVPLKETTNNLNGDNEEAEPESLNRKLEKMAHETNYPVPYRSKLTEPFEPGQTLIVKGKTVEDSVRFTISLHSNSADFSGNDVPLHISVRFDEGKIVFNTFSKGEWQKEERKSNPYKKGDPIDIRVRAHDNRFTITADQKEIKEYEHRVPLSSVSHFSIDGDIFVTHISWSGKYYPVPYESGIPGEGLAPGKTLLIYGTPEKKGKRFHINLLKKNGDIALHFNPRFDEKHIIRNSLINNEWGNEEREGKLPLEKGVGFDLKIVNEEYAFQIFLNDERYATFAHRLEPHDLNGLQIGGDVEITGIQIY